VCSAPSKSIFCGADFGSTNYLRSGIPNLYTISYHLDTSLGRCGTRHVARNFDRGVLLQPLRWCCVDCVIHHERDVREEEKYMYVARTGNNRVISSGGLYCCLLPRCEALRTCRSGFPIAIKWCCDQDVEIRVEFSLHTKHVRSVWFVVKRRGCCCNLTGGVALIV